LHDPRQALAAGGRDLVPIRSHVPSFSPGT
jgi:hypothetical protein